MTIGGSAAIVMVAVTVLALLYANRRGPAPHETVEVLPASGTQAVAAPLSTPIRSTDADGGAKPAEAPSIPAIEAASTAKDATTAEPPGERQALPQVPTNRVARPAKDAALRKKGPAPPTTVMQEPAPAETPAPAPVALTPPAPAAPTVSPALEPAKAEAVACADNSNPFSRELCLWQECAKPEYRSHPECARFSGPGGRR